MRGAYLIFAAISVVACGDSFLSSTGGADGGAGPTTGPTMTGPTSGGGAQGAGSATATTGSGGNGTCGPDRLAAPPLPPGWQSYVAISFDASESCPDGVNYDAYHNVILNSDCDCGCTIDEVRCRADLSTYGGATCDTQTMNSPQLVPGCNGPTDLSAVASVQFVATHSGQLCTAGEGVAAPIQYDKARLCDTDRDEDGCVPRLSPAFEPRVCIWQDGTVETCPAGFPMHFPYHGTIVDNRQCNDDCICGDVNTACGGMLDMYENDNCTAFLAGLAENTCDVLLSNVEGVAYVPNPTGGCTQQSGSTMGSIFEDEPATVCCTD